MPPLSAYPRFAGTHAVSGAILAPSPAARLPARSLVLVGLVGLSMAAGTTGLQSILPALGRRIGVADWMVAGVFSLSALAWTLASPAWGRVAERRGRKGLMLLGLAGFAVSMLGCGLDVLAGLHGWASPLWVFGSFAVLRSIFGLFGSAAGVASQAYVANNTDGAHRTASLAQLAGAGGLGTVLGPALAPLLVFPGLDLSGPMLGFGSAALLVLICILAGVEEPPFAHAGAGRTGDRRSGLSLWLDRQFLPVLACGLLLTSAQAVNGFVIGFRILDLLGGDPAQAQSRVVVVLIAGASVSLLAQWGLIGPLGLSARFLLRWGMPAAAAGNVVLALAHSYPALLAGHALACFGYALARPGFAAAISLAGTDEEQGWAAGAVSAVNGACIIATPMLGVLLYQLSHAAPFLLNMTLLLALAAWVWQAGSLAAMRR